MAIRTRRHKAEERELERLRAHHDEVDEVTKGAREFVGDMAKGIGGGWMSKGDAFRAHYDRIFGRKPDEGSV